MDKQADNRVEPKLLFSTEETILTWAVDYYDNGTAEIRNDYSDDFTHFTWKIVDGKVFVFEDGDGEGLASDDVQRAYKAYLQVELAKLIVGEELL